MLKVNIGSHNHKNVDTIDNVTLKYSWIKFIDLTLPLLHVAMCIELSSFEVLNPEIKSYKMVNLTF